MKRPSISNIVVALACVWFGATCYGCTYVAGPASVVPTACVIVSRFPHADTLIVGVFDPPCDASNPDSVFYWRVPAGRECALRAIFDSDNARAAIQRYCPPPSVEGVEVASGPRAP